MTEIPETLKRVHYRSLLEPYIKRDTGEDVGFLTSSAWQGWTIGIKPNDEHIQQMLFVEWICEELVKIDEQTFIEIASLLGHEQSDSAQRISVVDELDSSARQGGDIHSRMRAMLSYYNTLFESEFKLWSTLGYCLGTLLGSCKSQASTAQEYLNVSAGTKFHTLKSIAISFTQGSLSETVGDFDVDIRNAGVGHDSYEITDEDVLVLRPTNPKTGKLKTTGERRFTENELRNNLKAITRTVWSLKMGFFVFLMNNPQLRSKLTQVRSFKKSEILSLITRFAGDRSFLIEDFKWDKASRKMQLTIRLYLKVYKSERGMVYMNNKTMAVVQKELTAKYMNTMAPLLNRLVTCIEETELPHLTYTALDLEGKTVSQLEFKPDILKRFYSLPTPDKLPSPTVGEWSDKTHDRIIEMTIDSRMTEIWQRVLDDMPIDDVEFSQKMEELNANLPASIEKYLE